MRRLLVSLGMAMALGATVGTAAAQVPGVEEREVTIGRAVPLPGTLTVPEGEGRVPGVVLVHGSGPHDRDETVAANTPFRDLAAGLAAHGIAVLRYEKRTKVAPFSFIGRAYTVDEEVVDDALDAVAFLREQPRIDARRVVVVGHSLGGILAPRIARRDGRLAGIVIMAGTTLRSLPELVTAQFDYLASLPGADTARLRAARAQLETPLARLKTLTPADTLDTTPIAGAPARYWYDLARYDMAGTVRDLDLPVLVLQGDRDYQVTVADLEAWLAAVGDRPGLTVRRYPALNHLFIAGEGPSSPAEYAVPGTVDAGVVDDISRWVLALPPRGAR